MSTGAVANPSIASSLALLGSMPFDFIISGLNDLPNMQLITSLLNDQTGRWSFLQELFGHTMAVSIGNISTQTALAAGLNDQHASIFGAFGTTFPAYRCAADLGGSWAVSTRANPALPVQNIPSNIPAPAISAQFDISDRQTALSDGVATIKVVAGATVLERMVTTNTTSVEGVPSAVYRDVETLDCLTFIIRDLITYLSSTYGRKILVADGTPIPAGSFQCTAQIIKADIIGRYQTYVNQGIAQDFATFAATALAQNQGNGVVALQLPINVANQLRVLALQVDFTKS
jgi:phage tail sheath gpL-like